MVVTSNRLNVLSQGTIDFYFFSKCDISDSIRGDIGMRIGHVKLTGVNYFIIFTAMLLLLHVFK